MELVETILVLTVTLSILIAVHELGHFWAARLCGVKVVRFSIGFGKILFRYQMKPVVASPPPDGEPILTRSNEQVGTELVLAAIPLGGYVKMLDEREGFVADDERHLAFNRQRLRSRIAIVVAGPSANFLLATLCYWILFTAGVPGIVPLLGEISPASRAGIAGLRAGQEIIAVDGEETPSWSDVNLQLFKRIGDTGDIRIRARQRESGTVAEYGVSVTRWLAEEENPRPTRNLGLVLYQPTVPAVIGSLQSDGRGRQGGLQIGDRVEQVDGKRVGDWEELVELVQKNPERELVLTVLRGKESLSLSVVPARVVREEGELGYIGAGVQLMEIPEEMRREVSYSWYIAWYPAVAKTWAMTLFTLDSIKKMLLGAISSSNISGPITIAKVATASAKSGLESYIDFIALLSVSLGVLNLLPIPVLDGGHLLFYLAELIRGKPVSERVQAIGLQVGIVLLVGIMLLTFYNDIARF